MIRKRGGGHGRPQTGIVQTSRKLGWSKRNDWKRNNKKCKNTKCKKKSGNPAPVETNVRSNGTKKKRHQTANKRNHVTKRGPATPHCRATLSHTVRQSRIGAKSKTEKRKKRKRKRLGPGGRHSPNRPRPASPKAGAQGPASRGAGNGRSPCGGAQRGQQFSG